jgi:sRNA-binding protein
MKIGRTFPREELDLMIKYLADRYPAAFSTQPHLKVPLKKNIVDDLEKDGVLDDERRNAVINFYTQSWDYEYKLLAGAKRVDLNGKSVGAVTPTEQKEAEDRVRIQKQALREKQNPVEVMRKLHDNREISTDQFGKLTAPPLERTRPMVKTKTPNGAPELTQLRTLWGSIEELLARTEDSRLQAALIVPALRVFITEVEKFIGGFEGKV